MEKEQNTCKNCKYFSAYYVKRNARLSATSLGVCQHSKWRTVQQNQKREDLPACDFWESNELNDLKEKIGIKETLRNIEKSLEKIVLLLKEED